MISIDVKNSISIKLEEVKDKGEGALITYVTAGDPNLESTVKFVLELERAGADIIELGVPFSDPLADGPVIQKASQRAIKEGVTLKNILEAVQKIREESSIPLVLMTYLNPLYQFGLEKFAFEAKRAGVDGLIIPDLPFEEKAIIEEYLMEQGILLIPLIAPTTPRARIKEICKEANGFIYCVSITGVTGIRKVMSNNIKEFIEIVKEESKIPVAIGFGISTPEQAYEMGKISDGVIVGSALVKIIENKGTRATEELVPLIQQFKGALLAIGREEECKELT